MHLIIKSPESEQINLFNKRIEEERKMAEDSKKETMRGKVFDESFGLA